MRRRLPTAAGLTRQVAGCDDGVPGADRPGTQRLPAPMLDALSSEYPDLSGHLIVSALDAATTAAGESEQGRGRVLELARDRLDLTRERTAAAARRVAGRQSAAHGPHDLLPSRISVDTAGDQRIPA